ncbi:MAG TPA: hypothetical protein P5160_03105 [Candidatus Omnitrophota bacterium]|nr:hypothetical protein [Candidatus Omnitrophota bacterium]
MYRHTQPGWTTILSLGTALCVVLILNSVSYSPVAAVVAVVLALTIPLFFNLTVTIDQESLSAVFGIGVFRVRLKVSEIVSTRPVRNKWWYGYGIHGWFGKGWLINISGLDAVELKMKNGMTYWIGTDEPQELNAALQRAMNEAGS